MTQLLEPPSFHPRLTSTTGKSWVVGRTLTLLSTSFSNLIATVPKSKVFVVHRIMGTGALRAADAYDTVTLRMTDGSTNKDMVFLAPTLTLQAGKFRLNWNVHGRVVVPPGWRLQGAVSNTSDVVQLQVVGEYMGSGEAAQAGLFVNDLGNGIIGRNDVAVAGTRETLIAATTGMCIQILGLDVRGFANSAVTPAILTLEFSDGTNFFPITKFYHLGTDVNGACNESTALLDVTGPSGASVQITSSVDLAFSANLIYRLVPPDHANTWDTTGRHNDHGTASGGSTTTLVDASFASGTKIWIDDEWNGDEVVVISGTGAGQRRTITDTVGATGTLTVDPAWTATDATSVYRIEKASPRRAEKFWCFVDSTYQPFPVSFANQVVCNGITASGVTAGATPNSAYWAGSVASSPIQLSPGAVTLGTAPHPSDAIIRDDLNLPWPGHQAPPGVSLTLFTGNFGGLVWGEIRPLGHYRHLVPTTPAPNSNYQGA